MLHERLKCYQLSVELAGVLSKEATTWPRGFGYLSDQLRRAIASVVLNISEGNSRKGAAEKCRFFEIARASAAEVASCVDLMLAFNLISVQKEQEYKGSLHFISKALWSLMKYNR